MGLIDRIGSKIYIQVPPPRRPEKPPGPVRTWFLRGPGKRGQSYREMGLVAAVTYGGFLAGAGIIDHLRGLGGTPGHMGIKPIAISAGVAGVALLLAPRRHLTTICSVALLAVLAFWAAVLHPDELVFWLIIGICILAVAALIKLWGWNLDQ